MRMRLWRPKKKRASKAHLKSKYSWIAKFKKKRRMKANPADYYYVYAPFGKGQSLYLSRGGHRWRALAGQLRKKYLGRLRRFKIHSKTQYAMLAGKRTRGRLFKFLVIDVVKSQEVQTPVFATLPEASGGSMMMGGPLAARYQA